MERAQAEVESAQAVVFPDKNLEAALRSLVFEKKNNAEELTDDDLRKISTLEAKGRKIQNLSGLEKCTNLLLLDEPTNDLDVDTLRALMEEMSASTRSEPGALSYEWFIGDDDRVVHLYERYADSAAALARQRRALATHGVLAVWSEDKDAPYEKRFRAAGSCAAPVQDRWVNR